MIGRSAPTSRPAALRTLLAAWFTLAAGSTAAGAAPAAAKPTWKAGAAAVDITPAGPVWLAGYGARNRPSEGVAQRIFTKALALEDADGATFILVTADIIGIPRAVRDGVEQAARSRHGLAPASILLSASHTHSGPAPYAYGVPDPEYARKGEDYGRMLQDRILEAIAAALARREPARLMFSHARAGFAMNRRLPAGGQIRNSPNPDGPVDHDVPVLRVVDAHGRPRALVFGYACHNTVTGFHAINGDYAGYAQAFLEEKYPGAVALFVAGAAGDQNPYPRHASLEQSIQHGRTLAYAVEAALGVTAQRTLAGPLRSAYGAVELPFAPVTRAELEQRVQGKRGVEKLRAEELLRTLDAGGALPAGYPCPLQVVSFGPGLTLIAIAGEPTVEYSLRLKRELASARRAVWVAGYSNESIGYVGSRRVLEEGGYEGHSANLGRHPTPWRPEAEDRLVGRVHELLRSLE